MTQPSSVNVKVERINQVAIVVWDLELVTKNFWDILGIGPWDIYLWEAPLIYDRKYYGKPNWAREKIAVAQVGDVQLELVQPVEGDSIYRDYLIECGEGLHHLNFLVEDVDEVAEKLARQGFPTIQSGRYGPQDAKSGFNYIEIQPLGTIWEPVHPGEKHGANLTHYPGDDSEESPARVKISEIKQVGICVKDVVRTAENYWNILGIGPWEICEWGSPALYDRFYHGEPAWGREKIAHTYVGGVELELVQPVEGDSVYQDWIDEHGEGLHHLTFLCDDIDEVSTLLTTHGFTSIQSGHFGNPKERTGGCNYIEIPPLYCIWKAVHKPKGLPVEPCAHVP